MLLFHLCYQLSKESADSLVHAKFAILRRMNMYAFVLSCQHHVFNKNKTFLQISNCFITTPLISNVLQTDTVLVLIQMHRSAVHVMTASNIIDLDLDLTHLSTDTIILGHFDVITLGYCGIWINDKYRSMDIYFYSSKSTWTLNECLRWK